MGEPLSVTYEFTFPDGHAQALRVELRRPDLTVQGDLSAILPQWTRLGFQQCANCPLSTDTCTRCPVAARLVPVVVQFRDCPSTEQVTMTVRTQARSFEKRCSIQEGLSSLVGLVMVTSGCPVLDKLRPMVLTHLPFADSTETVYRAVSMYLLAQFFVAKNGGRPDWELDRLMDIYADVRTVNRDFAKRLAALGGEDANINALVKLDAFADIASFSIENDWWGGIEPLFGAFTSSVEREAPVCV